MGDGQGLAVAEVALHLRHSCKITLGRRALGAGKEAGQLQRLQLAERVHNVFYKVVARVSNVAQQILHRRRVGTEHRIPLALII